MQYTFKIAGAALVAATVAATGSAFTASSAVPDHKLGQDVGSISGYVTSGVAYTYDTAGTTITHASFTLDAAASVVKAKVNSSAATTAYASCTADTDTDGAGPDTAITNGWNCDVTDVTVTNSTGLDVFASSI